ncbi:hypothetical protein ORD22_05500 [Sporosarcina sp. GW1-11]|nr:hypothetical protein [Sporosarcina sp. GW1-11]
MIVFTITSEPEKDVAVDKGDKVGIQKVVEATIEKSAVKEELVSEAVPVSKEEPIIEEVIKKEPNVVKEPVEVKKAEAQKPKEVDVKKEIDTSVYEYVSNIDVTDARDINNHITLMIDMKTENQGLAFQHVLNQTYDFLQQTDIKDAKTIGINVCVKGNKVGMFTVYPERFQPNDNEPMADVVLVASEVEMVNSEVEEFGRLMELW